ncbi:hypothetical protein [Microcoleus asticus]|uniref:Uncharacterized protein n=1 Tax=Microcoleus asticus IPMA8 TaxID=2563858 RepID=A0ABX2D733_9CYAN|nr:hypothetical protein [Microcoleus asticus]NQE38361.1 hypothetical protein [Microcoleus asticus IPMA8]
MSRVSSKSSLSPSATRGSSAIDLGKDSGVDMGRKTTPSVTSGGIGITQEVANIGGMTVTGGVSVEVSPIRLDISGNPNFEDPSKSTIGIAGGAEIPGGILGVSGGITINTSTGEIEQVSIGGEIAGVGAEVSVSKDGSVGVGISLQIPFTPIEISFGLGFPNKPKKPNSEEMPQTSRPGVGSRIKEIPLAIFDNDCLYYVVYFQHGQATKLAYSQPFLKTGEHPYFKKGIWVDQGELVSQENLPADHYSPGFIEWHDFPTRGDRAGYKINDINGFAQLVGFGSSSPGEVNGNTAISYQNGASGYLYNYGASIRDWIATWVIPGTAWEFSIIKVSCRNTSPDTPPEHLTPISQIPPPSPSPTPFPNPPPRKEKMDACCQENLKFLRAIYTKLGLAKFPGQLPATIIQEVPKEGEEPAEPPQVPIPDLVSLIDWVFKRDDERWGQWEIQIDIKDADITKEGDQKKSLKFPNLAESIAELEGQILSLMTNVDALVAMQVRCLTESGMARQEAIKGYLASKAIIKYMAFKSTEIDVAVPMTFTPGAESISALIEESEGHIKGTDYEEKETFRDVCLDLLQAAAIIRAVHWQKIDSKNDTKSQLLSILKGTVDLAASITKPQNPNGENGDGKTFDPDKNFEDFIDETENGFRNTTGITDIQSPYGRSPDRRPRIREIGDNLSQAGGDN